MRGVVGDGGGVLRLIVHQAAARRFPHSCCRMPDEFRLYVSHAAMTRGEFLELTIVFLILLEIAMAVAEDSLTAG